MACNCKQTASAAQKYTYEDTMIDPKGVERVSDILSKIFIAILVFVVLIIATPFIVVYAVISVVTGKSINISKILKIFINGKSK